MTNNIKIVKKRGRPKGSKSNNKFIPSKDLITEPEYSTSSAQKLLELLSRGFLNSQCMSELNISKDTFYRWIRDHKDFKLAYDKGRPKAESVWAARLQDMALQGNDKGCKACIMILNNNFGWGNTGDVAKNSINKFTQINVSGDVNLLEQKTKAELIETLKEDLNILASKNAIDADYKIIETTDDQNNRSD